VDVVVRLQNGLAHGRTRIVCRMVIVGRKQALEGKLTCDLAGQSAPHAIGDRVEATTLCKNGRLFRLVKIELILVVLAHLPHIGAGRKLDEGKTTRRSRPVRTPTSHQNLAL